MVICYRLVLKCKIFQCGIVSFPWEVCCVWGNWWFHYPHLCSFSEAGNCYHSKRMCATMQLYKETESRFLRVPDCAGLFSKVLHRIFSTKIGVNCVPFGKEWAGHSRAKIGIVQRMKFLFTDVVLGWADLMNWISFQMGVFFLIANFLQFISRNSSHFARSLWPWFRWLMYLPSDTCGFFFYFCSFCLALPTSPLGCHL